MKRLSMCLAVAAALALPATAGAASQFFGGKIDSGGKIGIDVTTQGGEPFQIDAMRYKKFPINCTGNPNPLIVDGTWTFTNFLVQNNGRFLFDDDAPSGDHLYFKGEFENNGKKIEGKVKAGPLDGGANGTCTTAKRGYNAGRGNKGPHPKLKAKVGSAFRVAG